MSIINKRVHEALGGEAKLPLSATSRLIRAYGGEPIDILGETGVTVDNDTGTQELKVLVSNGIQPCIFGGDWIRALQPNFTVNTVSDLSAHLTLKDGTVPIFIRPRQIAYGLREQVREELERLEREKVLVKVEHSDWATPIVPVRKPDGRIRLCGDFKVTLNKHLSDCVSTTPSMEDIINSMGGSRWFSELDLRHAYHQLPLDYESSLLTTLSTPFGLFRHTTLPFGIKTAPAIFQAAMDKLFCGISGIQIYQDNVYVHAASREEHDLLLQTVEGRLRARNFELNEAKCKRAMKQLTVLGTVINGSEARPDPERTAVITQLAPPRNVKEVRSLLGMVEFYGRFIPHLSSLKEPLTELTRAGRQFVWKKEQEDAFKKLKRALCSNAVLRIYDPELQVILRCDASPTGIGAVLEQEGRPVLFVSKTLSPAERNYAQIEREALAITWAVRRLHKYLVGRKFVLVTDNAPLQFIFSPSKAIPSVAAARIQRWALFLMGYDYCIQRVTSEDNSAADFLSRYAGDDEAKTFDATVSQVDSMQLPLNKQRVHEHARRDPLMRELFSLTKNGWHGRRSQVFLRYAQFRNELTITDSLLYRGEQLVIPDSLQREVIAALHEGHPGSAAMKAAARTCVWWLNMSKDIAAATRRCVGCCSAKGQPHSSWLPWPTEKEPWQRVHADFAGPLRNGQYALILIDAHSKWPEVHLMPTMTSTATIQRLRRTFAQEGVPQVLVTDNGPSLVSKEIESWLSAIGCRHIRTPPYHPRSNGIAERFVRTFKEHVHAARDSADLQAITDRFLLMYRNTPHSVTGEAPAVLMKGRPLRSRTTALGAAGDKLWVRKESQTPQPQWQPATIVGTEGSRVVKVELPDGEKRRCHDEQTKPREDRDQVEDSGSGDEPPQAAPPEPRPRRRTRPPDRLGCVPFS